MTTNSVFFTYGNFSTSWLHVEETTSTTSANHLGKLAIHDTSSQCVEEEYRLRKELIEDNSACATQKKTSSDQISSTFKKFVHRNWEVSTQRFASQEFTEVLIRGSAIIKLRCIYRTLSSYTLFPS